MRRIALIVCVMLFWLSSYVSGELTPEEKTRIEMLIKQMGDRDFAVREDATKKLIETGPDVLPLLRKVFEETDDPELKMRTGRVLREVKLPERVLKDFGEKPAGLVQLMMNANRKTLIYRVGRDGKLVLIHEGKESAAYDSFGEYYLTNDPNRVLYIGRIDKKCHAVVDGVVTEHEYASFLRYSEDGRHVGYLGRREKDFFMVLDGKELPEYESMWGIQFAGEYLISGAKKGERWVFAMNSSEGPEHDKVFPAGPFDVPRYVAIDGREVWLCTVELPAKGEPLPDKLAEVRVKQLALLDEDYAKQDIYIDRATTRDVLLHGNTARNCQVFHDGKLVGVYEGHNGGTPSPDGERLAVIATRARAYHVLLDGESFGPYESAWSPPVFAAEGKRFAFFAQRGGQWFVVCDGKESDGVPFGPNVIVFSPDCARVAAQLGDGMNRVVMLDGKIVGRYAKPRDDAGGRLGWEGDRFRPVRSDPSPPALAFSPDGKHLAWVGGRGKDEFIVVDGREGPPYGGINWVRFSSDGNHLCYLAQRRDAPDGPVRPRMVVDNIEAPPSETINGPHDRYPLDRLTYITLAPDNRFKLVEVAWPKSFDWTNGLKPAPEE
jgi:hypothetical protein